MKKLTLFGLLAFSGASIINASTSVARPNAEQPDAEAELRSTSELKRAPAKRNKTKNAAKIKAINTKGKPTPPEANPWDTPEYDDALASMKSAMNAAADEDEEASTKSITRRQLGKQVAEEAAAAARRKPAQKVGKEAAMLAHKIKGDTPRKAHYELALDLLGSLSKIDGESVSLANLKDDLKRKVQLDGQSLDRLSREAQAARDDENLAYAEALSQVVDQLVLHDKKALSMLGLTPENQISRQEINDKLQARYIAENRGRIIEETPSEKHAALKAAYEKIGVKFGAPISEVRKSYLALMKKHNNNEKLMAQINAAYNLIKEADALRLPTPPAAPKRNAGAGAEGTPTPPAAPVDRSQRGGASSDQVTQGGALATNKNIPPAPRPKKDGGVSSPDVIQAKDKALKLLEEAAAVVKSNKPEAEKTKALQVIARNTFKLLKDAGLLGDYELAPEGVQVQSFMMPETSGDAGKKHAKAHKVKNKKAHADKKDKKNKKDVKVQGMDKKKVVQDLKELEDVEVQMINDINAPKFNSRTQPKTNKHGHHKTTQKVRHN